MSNQRAALIIGILLSVVLLGAVLAGVDLGRVLAALAGADYVYLVPAVLLLFVGHFARALRWRALLVGRLPLGRTFNILNISYLFNGVLPFRLGEVVRMFLATRADPPVPVFTSLSTILVERLLDLLAVLMLLGGVLVVLPLPAAVTTAGLTLGLGALVGITALVVFARRRAWAFRLLVIATRLLPFLERWGAQAALTRFLDGLQPLASKRGVVMALGWSVVAWAFSAAAGYVLMYAFFPQPTWVATCLLITLASLAVAVPYAPGAVGPFEASVVFALGLAGLGQPEGAAVAFAVILHATNLGFYTLLGIIGLLGEGVTLGQVARGARTLRPAATSSSGD